MILSLHLTNFTIISQLDLEFEAGMTVFTGETGAGKSIIIDAIQLALGSRLESRIVREGTDKSMITLVFDIRGISSAQTWLSNHDLFSDNKDECVLRRTISKEGRSRAFINNQPCTLSDLANLGELLLQIHGQHHQQGLLQKNSQLHMLDLYGQHTVLIEKVSQLANAWQQTQKNLQHFEKLASEATQRKEFLQFQLQEFAEVNLQENELSLLDNEFKQLANADNLLQETQFSYHLLSDSDAAILPQLQQCVRGLNRIKDFDSELINAQTLLENAEILLQEANDIVKNFHNKIEINPERLQQIDERLGLIHDLARKHRVNPEELLQVENKLQKELQELDHCTEQLQTLEKELLSLKEDYSKAAKKLTKARQLVAKELNELISKDMQTLNMRGSVFQIALSPKQDQTPGRHGLETVEFMVATNTGQHLQALTKIASGGELSRISLAIQVNTARKMQTPVLIFDEVDTGIGGATADIVGSLLKQLSTQTQVFCITHLPQVASKADNHFNVQKVVKKKETFTEVTLLSATMRVKEISRMLSGNSENQASLENAKEMLAVS